VEVMSATSTPNDAGSETAESELRQLEGKKVKNTNEKLDVEEGRVESVEEDHLYGGDLRATITYPGNIGRECVKPEKLVNGETDWKVVE
jgi:hypothetical protein